MDKRMMKYTSEYWNSIEKNINVIKNVERLKNKSILITGSTGLICSCVIDLLIYLNSLGYDIKIYAASRNDSTLKERFGKLYSKINYVKYDALKKIHLNFNVDYIIHGASNANPKAYVEEPVETMLANIIGVKNLLDYAKKMKARLLYISSSEVYGNKSSSSSYKESDYNYLDILNPRACYPSSKRAAETLCSSYRAEYEVDFVIVRPGHIYGPTMSKKDNRAYAQFARNAISGKNIIMKSPGMQLRSYCYVVDCASAIITVLLNGSVGEPYNISNHNSIITIRELAETMAKIGKVNVVFEIPSNLEKLGYNLMDNSSLCSDKLESLGWSGITSIDEGCRHMLSEME